MSTKRLCRIAILAALEFVIFYSLSNILYIEAITLTIITVALALDKSEAILSSIVFGCILILYMGLTPWTIMYLMIYPLYSLLTIFNSTVLITLPGYNPLVSTLRSISAILSPF